MTIEDPLLSAHGYQLLPIATSQWVGDNSKLDLSGIFCGVLLIAGRAHLQIIENLSSVGLKVELLFFAYKPPIWNSSLLDIWFHLDIVQILFGHKMNSIQFILSQ